MKKVIVNIFVVIALASYSMSMLSMEQNTQAIAQPDTPQPKGLFQKLRKKNKKAVEKLKAASNESSPVAKSPASESKTTPDTSNGKTHKKKARPNKNNRKRKSLQRKDKAATDDSQARAEMNISNPVLLGRKTGWDAIVDGSKIKEDNDYILGEPAISQKEVAPEEKEKIVGELPIESKEDNGSPAKRGHGQSPKKPLTSEEKKKTMRHLKAAKQTLSGSTIILPEQKSEELRAQDPVKAEETREADLRNAVFADEFEKTLNTLNIGTEQAPQAPTSGQIQKERITIEDVTEQDSIPKNVDAEILTGMGLDESAKQENNETNNTAVAAKGNQNSREKRKQGKVSTLVAKLNEERRESDAYLHGVGLDSRRQETHSQMSANDVAEKKVKEAAQGKKREIRSPKQTINMDTLKPKNRDAQQPQESWFTRNRSVLLAGGAVAAGGFALYKNGGLPEGVRSAFKTEDKDGLTFMQRVQEQKLTKKDAAYIACALAALGIVAYKVGSYFDLSKKLSEHKLLLLGLTGLAGGAALAWKLYTDNSWQKRYCRFAGSLSKEIRAEFNQLLEAGAIDPLKLKKDRAFMKALSQEDMQKLDSIIEKYTAAQTAVKKAA